jgi:hypothetical protein
MDEKILEEYKELQSLEAQDSLDDIQRVRLDSLKLVEQVEKTISEKTKKDLDSALAQKDHYRTKFEKEEADRKTLEDKLNKKGEAGDSGLNVEDYIDISASLEGLDQREKEFLARQHKLTGKPLPEIRKEEDFQLWQSAHRAKLEKENALAPSSTQTETDKPSTLEDRIAKASSIEEKEKLLTEAGLYKAPRPRPDRVHIGNQR